MVERRQQARKRNGGGTMSGVVEVAELVKLSSKTATI